MEPVEGAAFHIMDVRLHHPLHDDGGGARLRPGIRPRAMARQRRLRRRDALPRARGGSDHRQRSPRLADEIDRADQHRPRPVRVAPAAPREVRRRTGPHQWRTVGHQRRHRLQAERVPHVRARADRARPSLRDGGRVHHHHGAALDRRRGTQLRRAILEDGARLPGAKAGTAASVPGQRRVVRCRARLRGEAFRPDLHHQSRRRRSGRRPARLCPRTTRGSKVSPANIGAR